MSIGQKGYRQIPFPWKEMRLSPEAGRRLDAVAADLDEDDYRLILALLSDCVSEYGVEPIETTVQRMLFRLVDIGIGAEMDGFFLASNPSVLEAAKRKSDEIWSGLVRFDQGVLDGFGPPSPTVCLVDRDIYAMGVHTLNCDVAEFLSLLGVKCDEELAGNLKMTILLQSILGDRTDEERRAGGGVLCARDHATGCVAVVFLPKQHHPEMFRRRRDGRTEITGRLHDAEKASAN